MSILCGRGVSDSKLGPLQEVIGEGTVDEGTFRPSRGKDM